MDEQNGFKETEPQNRNEDFAETPFQNELDYRNRESDSGIGSQLQYLSPDKPVFAAEELSRLNPEQLALLKKGIAAQIEQCDKVDGPLRTAYHKEMQQNEGSAWAQGYRDKVGSVLNDNINELASEIPFRVAFPVQSFTPGADGVVQAENLYAFFPPLTTNINERYVTFPLHSANAMREKQLRASGSFAAEISSDEFKFRCKMTKVDSGTLLERRGAREEQYA